MDFERLLGSLFPGADDEAAFVRTTSNALLPLGFSRGNTLACLATCRDEVAQSLARAVTETWGPPFNLSGLGGLNPAGPAGFRAALLHAPSPDGRQRYVFLAGPHVAIGGDGEPGPCRRFGRADEAPACGALVALLQEIQEGASVPADDPQDLEFGRLRERVSAHLRGRQIPDLLALTRLVHEVILDDLEAMIAAHVDGAHADYAVATGIQVHAPDGRNLIQPRTLYAVVDGQRHDVGRSWGVPN